jgi:hypothetical protein
MASSAFSSVMGKPFNAGSCFGFLSLAAAAGRPATAGTSIPKDNMQVNAKNTASNAFGRRETVVGEEWLECLRGSSFAWLGFMPAPYKMNPTDVRKLQSAWRCVECRDSLKKPKNGYLTEAMLRTASRFG